MKIRPLSTALQEMAENELHEIPSQIEEQLTHLRNWLNQQTHIKYKNGDQLLVNLLRITKYKVQRTKELLEGYYTFRTMAPELTYNIDPLFPDFASFLKIGMCLPLPVSENDVASARVFLLRFGDYDPEKVTVTTLARAGYGIMEIFFNDDDNFVIAGAKAIVDMNGSRFQTALQITPIINKLVYFCEKAFLTRIQAAHIINIPMFFEPILGAAKLLLPKKMVKRVHLYSSNNWEDIYKDIPKSILPFEYGGNAGSIEDLAVKWKSKIESYRETLLNENKYRVCEAAKQYTKHITDGFGTHGTFKSLQID